MKKIFCMCICLLLTSIGSAQIMGNTAEAMSAIFLRDKHKKEFEKSVEKNDVAEVEWYLGSMPKWVRVMMVNEVNDSSRLTPLMVASRNASLRMVETLVELGAFVNATDSEGRTALCYVPGEAYNKGIPEYLLAHNAHLKIQCGLEGKYAEFITPFAIAMQNKPSAKLLKAFIKASPQLVNQYIPDDKCVATTLQMAYRDSVEAAAKGNRSFENMNILLEAGADINRIAPISSKNCSKVNTLAAEALYACDYEGLKYVLNHGGTIDEERMLQGQKETPQQVADSCKVKYKDSTKPQYANAGDIASYLWDKGYRR